MTALMALVGSLVVAPPAAATSTLLCKGFTACADAGYSSYGYGPTEYKKMWWRMYAGHNCTNYVAYRMIRNGMSTERPWSGSGDARNWGVVFADKTDQNPMVGSVAWWSSGSHVAYVQRIIDADTIVISEDHYGGDFDWRKITRSGGGWPNGFIHLADEILTAKYPPRVVGTAQVDETLSATSGSWSAKNVTLSYQWRANGVSIPGATATTYQPTPDQVGDEFTIRVLARRTGYRTGASASSATDPVAPGVMVVDSVPELTGSAKVGAVLTATDASWTPAADASTFIWSADGVTIAGATGRNFTLTDAELGKRISVAARGTKAGYKTSVVPSVETEPVAPGKLTVEAEPRISGRPYIGREYRVTPGVVAPAGATARYQWYASGVRIPGATAATYVPTIDVVAKRLRVDIVYSKPGYTSIKRTLDAPKLVKAYPRIFVASRATNSVTVVISADEIPVVRGKVTITGPGGQTITRDLENGRITVSASWLKSGPLTLTVAYLGSSRVDSRTRTATVTIM